MFTGIVTEVGELLAVEPRGGDTRVEVGFRNIEPARARPGDSIAVDGVCLTVAEIRPASFLADVSGETLRVTTLGAKAAGARVNLEPALRAGDALGGHWVSGHVDGVAEVVSVTEEARSLRVGFAVPPALAKYIARKGSVTLDGVSLTVNEVDGAKFSVNLIPHTREVTTFGALAPGVRVNLEVDVLARYVERLREA
jgi:riboflavin synthase